MSKQRNNMVNSKKIVLLSVYSAMALIMFAVENLFPSFFVPGAKMGLGNIFVLLSLVTLGEWQAYVVLTVKCLLGSLVVGNVSALLYSLSAGAVSLTVAIILYNVLKNKISLVSVSVASAVLHNATQNAVYALVTGSVAVFGYLPYLTLLGGISGCVVGFAVVLLLKNMPSKIWNGIYID